MRRFIKTFKNSILGKILRAIFKVLLWGLEILVIFLAIVILTQRLTNDQDTFLGFRIYNVATGSMEPEYAVGDILISRERDPNEIKVGDNIVYLGKEGGYAGKIITHAVIQIEKNEKGEILFHTKGRANTVEDPIVHEEQLYGVIVQNNIVLAWICKILTNRYGLYFCVVIPVIIYAFIGFVKAQGEKIEQEKQEELERRKRKEAMRKKRKQMEMKKRRVIEIEEDDELIDEEEYEEIIEEQEDEEIIEEVKPKTKKTTKSNSNNTSSTKSTTKTKTTNKSATKTTSSTKSANKTTSANKKATKTKSATKTSNTGSTPKKTSTKKKAKEE